MPPQAKPAAGKGAKELTAMIKLQCPAGAANPAPPVGPALGQHGVNIGQFVKEYNEATRDQMGLIVPAEITVYKDRSFSFVLKTPPASVLLKRAAGIVKGNAGPEVVGQVTEAQIKEIATTKLPDLNARDLEAACRIVKGTARSMGIQVVV